MLTYATTIHQLSIICIKRDISDWHITTLPPIYRNVSALAWVFVLHKRGLAYPIIGTEAGRIDGIDPSPVNQGIIHQLSG